MYKIQEKILSLFAFAFKRLLCQVLYTNKCIPPSCKLHPNRWSRTGTEPSLRGQIVEGLSLIASGRYLSHRLNFILSKQPRSPATEGRNPGAPDLTKNVGSYFSPDLPALTLISLEPPDLTKNVGSYLSPNLPALTMISPITEFFRTKINIIISLQYTTEWNSKLN